MAPDMEDTYRTLASPCEGLFKAKGSKHFGYGFPIASESEVKVHLERFEHGGNPTALHRNRNDGKEQVEWQHLLTENKFAPRTRKLWAINNQRRRESILRMAP